MNCNCEKAPEFPTRAFIPGPIEIPINFRAVTIPADQGDDTTNPPLNGAYRNVVLQYAANNHTYIYSSDGIPVMLVGGINFDEIANRPLYDGEPMTSDTNIPDLTDEVSTLQSEVQALATDFSYKGSVADYAHLPSDAAVGDVYTTLDTGLIYVWDGTQWVALNETTPVVQVPGTSTTDVMSQNATTSMIFADPGTREKIRIGNTSTVGDYSVVIGVDAIAPGDASVSIGNGCGEDGIGNVFIGNGVGDPDNGSGEYYRVGIGWGANPQSYGSMAIGTNSHVGDNSRGAIALGHECWLPDNSQGVMSIGTRSTASGYSNSEYRLLTGLYTPQAAHDAATKGYIDGLVIRNAGAPTTATVGTVGQLLTDTTNGKLYICTAIVPGTDPNPDTYTWKEIVDSTNVVQTTGTSTTDVMSQDGVSKLLFGEYNHNYDKERIKIGSGASATAGNSTAIGHNASSTSGSGIAIGYEARDAQSSVGLGAFSQPSSRGEVNIGIPRATSTQIASYGHNNTPYRLLTGVSDPESAHDAATKGYVDTAVAGAGAATINSTDWSALWQ